MSTLLTVAHTSPVCHTPHKRYETRTKSTPQGTPWPVTWKPKAGNAQPNDDDDDDIKLVKPVTPILPLGDGSTKTSDTSSPSGICETEEVKPLQASTTATAMVAANHLRDSDDKLHYRHLTSNGRKVLKEITENTSETGHVMEFHGVNAREYEVLQHVLEEMGRIKPRLAYDYIKHHLLVDMPGHIHEAPFTHIKDVLARTISCLPYDHDVICPTVNMNLLLEIKDQTVTPDISITLTKAERPITELLVPLIGECICSETKSHVMGKMKKTIDAHPEIDMVILGIVHEAQAYKCPKTGSVASETLLKSPTPIPRSKFITKSFPLCESVKIADHNWCHLDLVEFFVWVKRDGDVKIYLDKEDEDHMARGVLYPEVRMDAFTEMFQRGLERIRDAFVAFTKRVDTTVDVTSLQEADVAFPICWKDAFISANVSVDATAYARYKHWHENKTNCIKRTRDPSYSPPDSESDDAGLQEATSLSHGRPRRKQRPASQLPLRKRRPASQPLPRKSKLTQVGQKRHG